VNESSKIDGVIISNLRQIPDERGSILHMLRCDDSEFEQFGECYFSEVIPGAVKAWKFHQKQTQNITVPTGRIQFVIYDNRDSSKTIGKLQIIEIGRPDSYIRIKIPPRLWYGFSCISLSTALLVNCADIPHDKMESRIKKADDPSIPYSWNNKNIEIT